MYNLLSGSNHNKNKNYLIKYKRLNNLSVLETRKKSNQKLTRNSKLFKTIIHAIQEKKGTNIVSLDLRKIPEAVSDFFIICEANNSIQLKAIADSVDWEVKQNCGECRRTEGPGQNL